MPQPFCSTIEVLEKMYPLMVYNSLTRTKTRFIPNDAKTITWYQCGPTVYAESHMGHARTYVSLDVIRRILKDYFGYNVLLCQNVTDIDDKIIIRSGERGMPFRELASKYEDEFYEDMASLGVQLPDMSTRVSEYVEEIVSYIEDLISKEIAYESNGSVYFSVQSFEAKGHTYGKLVPEQIGNSELLAEGEGALASAEASDKRAPSDFALWKKTKDRPVTEDDSAPKEPHWESPWGHGRPGWHIECSVMCASAMKKFAAEGYTTPKGRGSLDVHAGGVDLKFPHHENEIAQSEAYSGSHQWVNYWLHTGHLNIKGFKMSKSLKNFITIRQGLELHSARQLRFCFLLHKYNSTMDYGDSTMAQAVIMDKTFSEYFQNVKALLRRLVALPNASQKVGEAEEGMLEKLEAAKTDVRLCLLDDFNTPGAVSVLAELLRDCNKYMETPLATMSSVVLSSVARYVTSMMNVFGLIVEGKGSDIGFPLGASSDESGVSSSSKEEVMTPLLDILTKFR
jgi:cysteinyl-tRNA synthetase